MLTTNKRILLIGGNYAPELTGIGKYNGEMMKWFADRGLTVTIITTYPYYPEWSIHSQYKSKSHWYSTEKIQHNNTIETIIRCPHYVPQNPSGLKRLISDTTIFFSFFIALIGQLFKAKHDYVLSVAPPFSIGILGMLYKTLRGGKTIYHIQDLQIDAARDLNMIKSHAVLNILFTIEKFILKHTDYISTISAGMIKKIEEKCEKPVTFFPNWADVDAYFPLTNKIALKAKFGFDKEDKIVLYSGAIGEKQGLEMILNTAGNLKDERVKFIICGVGPFKAKLEMLAQKQHLKNVVFMPLQSAANFNAFLNVADVHLVLQKGSASDLVLPSKLMTILSVGGVAIVSAMPGTSLYSMMQNNKLGMVIPPENQHDLDKAVALALNSDLQTWAINARNYAEQNLSIHAILTSFCKKIIHFQHVETQSINKQSQTLKTISNYNG